MRIAESRSILKYNSKRVPFANICPHVSSSTKYTASTNERPYSSKPFSFNFGPNKSVSRNHFINNKTDLEMNGTKLEILTESLNQHLRDIVKIKQELCHFNESELKVPMRHYLLKQINFPKSVRVRIKCLHNSTSNLFKSKSKRMLTPNCSTRYFNKPINRKELLNKLYFCKDFREILGNRRSSQGMYT